LSPASRLAGREAFVVGSGPNGLTAAILLARAGMVVTVLEAQPTIGGGARSAALTLPGFTHDLCSAVHPLAAASPAFAQMPLADYGLEWIHPPVAAAHPLDDGSAVTLVRSVDATADGLAADGEAYRHAVAPMVARWPDLLSGILAPPHLPAHPLLLARFGVYALPSASFVFTRLFRTAGARALLGGVAAHSILPLDAWGSAAMGWVLTLAAHAAGWPMPRGGAQQITAALASYLRSLSGIPARRAGVLRPRAARAAANCGGAPAGLVLPQAGAIPPGTGRFQSGLGAECADSLAQPGVRPRRHGPPVRNARGD